MTTVVSRRRLFARVAIDSIRLCPYRSFKILAFRPGHTARRLSKRGKTAFIAFRIQAMNVTSHFRQFTGRKLMQIAKYGIDYTHPH